MPSAQMRFAAEKIAVACLHLVVGRAVLDFPDSTQAAPSPYVTVSLGLRKELAPQFRYVFPLQVDTFTWHNAVVPVLTDDRYRIDTSSIVPHPNGAPTTTLAPSRNELLGRMYAQGEWEGLVDLYVGALIQSLQRAGYLPTDELYGQGPVSQTVPDAVAPGEPVVKPALPEPLVYLKFDGA